MTSRVGIAAQINMYPMDVKHVETLLPHQIRAWGDMVDRIVVTIDTHQSRSGRYRGNNFMDSLERLRAAIANLQRSHPKLEAIEIDYSPEAQRAVARYFFDSETIPVKAWDGGPFYSYFYGLYATQGRYIIHFDGDMMFGGGSRTWMREAIEMMEARPEVFLASPFPGPPREDGKIFGHQEEQGFVWQREATNGNLAYSFTHASTRIFMIDMQRFEQQLKSLPLLRPGFKQRIKSHLLGNPPIAREAEVILSYTLGTRGMKRVDFLGAAPGMWSLHPPYRSEEFYRQLPEFVSAIESGRIPDDQRGHYDMNDSMIDWSQAREATRWYRRYYRMFKDRLSISA